MKIICRDRQRKNKAEGPEGRAVSSVVQDIDLLLSPKSFEELEALEKQIHKKLRSNEDIDVDYWEQLLQSLIVWKARAKLKKVYKAVIESRMEILRKQQTEEAEAIRQKLESVLIGPQPVLEDTGDNDENKEGEEKEKVYTEKKPLKYSKEMDPDPMLKLRYDDKGLEQMDERYFLKKLVCTLQRNSGKKETYPLPIPLCTLYIVFAKTEFSLTLHLTK